MAGEVSEQKFLHAYGNLLVQCWGNPAVKKKFLNDPPEVLKDFGLDPGSAKIVIREPGSVNNDPSTWTAESQVRLWNDGLKSGSIDFFFPEEPPDSVSNAQLSDEDLEAIAGGWTLSSCCCTPCCSC